jgi:hypothetical protein
MQIKESFTKYLNLKLLGIISSLLILISEFLPWISSNSLLDRYILYSLVSIQESFLYLIPLVSGIIGIVGFIFIMIDSKHKIKSTILNFMSLGFLLIFFIDFIPSELTYIIGAGIGFYICISGSILFIFNLINILMLKEE